MSLSLIANILSTSCVEYDTFVVLYTVPSVPITALAIPVEVPGLLIFKPPPIRTLPLSLVVATLSLPIVTSLDTVADDG